MKCLEEKPDERISSAQQLLDIFNKQNLLIVPDNASLREYLMDLFSSEMKSEQLTLKMYLENNGDISSLESGDKFPEGCKESSKPLKDIDREDEVDWEKGEGLLQSEQQNVTLEVETAVGEQTQAMPSKSALFPVKPVERTVECKPRRKSVPKSFTTENTLDVFSTSNEVTLTAEIAITDSADSCLQ